MKNTNPTWLRMWDSSTCASNFAALVLSEFHYPAPLRFGDSSTNDSNFIPTRRDSLSSGLTTFFPARSLLKYSMRSVKQI